MEQSKRRVHILEAHEEHLATDSSKPLEAAIARIFIRRDASRRSLQILEDFLRRSAVGDYAIGVAGSARAGYWSTVDVTDIRDLDRIRTELRHLVDGWRLL